MQAKFLHPVEPRSGGLLSLPLEVRTRIYGHALGPEPIYLKFRGILIQFSPCPVHIQLLRFYIRRNRCDERPRTGLPEWILTSKDVCTEVADLISRTWWFRAAGAIRQSLGSGYRHETYSHSFPLDERVEISLQYPSFNSFICHSRSFQHIIIPPNTSTEGLLDRDPGITAYAVDAVPQFLTILQALNVKDISLESDWKRKSRDYPPAKASRPTSAKLLLHEIIDCKDERMFNPGGYLDIFHHDWDPLWYGKFRKVTVIQMVGPDNPATNAMDNAHAKQAEICARRLVGAEGETSRKDILPRDDTGGCGIMRLTVERKV